MRFDDDGGLGGRSGRVRRRGRDSGVGDGEKEGGCLVVLLLEVKGWWCEIVKIDNVTCYCVLC